MHHNKKRQSGFSMIELIIYLFISAFVLVATTVFIWDIIDQKIKTVAYQETQQNARLIMTKLKQITSQGTHFDCDCNIPDDLTESGAELCFIDEIDNITYKFKIEDGVIQLSDDNGFSYQNLSSDQVEVSQFDITNSSYPPGVCDSYRVETFTTDIKVSHRNPNNLQALFAESDLQGTFTLQNN